MQERKNSLAFKLSKIYFIKKHSKGVYDSLILIRDKKK
jgi:hypothetical protein